MLAQAGASAAEAGSNFSEVDQSLVQRCTELAFQKAAERGDNLPPTLQDFYDAANEQPEEQAQVIALRYERFVKGSMNFFNHQSNVDFNTRIVDFNLKDLPDSMLVFALINVCEAVRNRMYFNAKRNVRTWLYVEEIDTNNSELFLRALGEGGYYTASQDSYIAQYRSICQAYPLVAQLDSMTAEEFKNRYSGTTLIPGGGQDYQSADQWQKDIVNACSQTPWPGANLCATWTTRVYARAGHPVGGNGNTQLGNQGYGANYSQKRATTDLSQIKVGMLVSAQYGSNTAAGNAYGHVGIYIGDGKVMDSIYSGLRTISLSDWVSQNGRGWVVCGYPWDWR